MNSPDDELGGLIGSSDPTRTDEPPARGSARYRSILETAMTTQTPDTPAPDPNATTPTTSPDQAVPMDQPPRSGRPAPGRWLLGAAAAAIVLALIGGAVVLQSNSTSEPAGSTTSVPPTPAADEIMSLQAEVTIIPTDGAGSTRSTHRVNGDSRESTSASTYPDGHTESSTLIRIGGEEYETIEGVTTRRSLPVEEPTPFAMSSAKVIKTLRGNSVTLDEREVELDDGPATRLELEPTPQLSAALSALSAGELAWFELEYPAEVESVTLWVTDQVVRQIEVTSAGQVSRTRFFDFNGDITITVPPGPYVDATRLTTPHYAVNSGCQSTHGVDR